MHDVQDGAFYIFSMAPFLLHIMFSARAERCGEELSRRPLNPWLNPAVLLKWRHARSHSLPIMCALQSQREPLGAYLKLVTKAMRFKGSLSLSCSRFVGKEETNDVVASSQGSRKTTLHKWASSAHRHTHTKCQCTAPKNRHFFAAALVVFFLAKVHNKIWFSGRREEIDQDALGLCEPLDTVFSAIKFSYLL